MPRYAQAGELIVIERGIGRVLTDDASETIELEIQPACELNQGHWYCVEHQRGFPHNLAAMSHYTEHEAICKFAWICHEHGPEAHE